MIYDLSPKLRNFLGNSVVKEIPQLTFTSVSEEHALLNHIGLQHLLSAISENRISYSLLGKLKLPTIDVNEMGKTIIKPAQVLVSVGFMDRQGRGEVSTKIRSYNSCSYSFALESDALLDNLIQTAINEFSTAMKVIEADL